MLISCSVAVGPKPFTDYSQSTIPLLNGIYVLCRIAVYKALYRIFGGFVADVVAAIDQVLLILSIYQEDDGGMLFTVIPQKMDLFYFQIYFSLWTLYNCSRFLVSIIYIIMT